MSTNNFYSFSCISKKYRKTGSSIGGGTRHLLHRSFLLAQLESITLKKQVYLYYLE